MFNKICFLCVSDFNTSLTSKRSLGCVLYEMIRLEKAFPDGPVETGRNRMLTEFSKHTLFNSILKK